MQAMGGTGCEAFFTDCSQVQQHSRYYRLHIYSMLDVLVTNIVFQRVFSPHAFCFSSSTVIILSH
jgi:hypothetical protein